MRKKLRHWYDTFRTYAGVKKAFAWLCILWGVVAFVTPFTPGSWLFFVGLISLMGNDEARKLVHSVIGERWYARLKLHTFFKDDVL